VPSSRFRSAVSGRFKPIEPELTDEPFRPFDLHLPQTWRKRRFEAVTWAALYEPMRAVERYDVPLRYGVFDRYREICRKVQLKNGKSATWKPIGRATLIWDWDTRPLGYYPQHWHPAPDIWIGWDPTRARYQTLAIVNSRYAPDDFIRSGAVRARYHNKGRFRGLERWFREFKWSTGPMCRASRRNVLPPVRKPHGLIPPFTHCNWSRVPVNDYKTAGFVDVPPGVRIYFVRTVNN
jgi:hypothetical protein